MNFNTLSAWDLQYRVEQLLARYAQCIDDDRLEEWPVFFTDPCLYKIAARENVERELPLAAIFCDSRGMLIDRIVSLRQANVYEAHHYRHMISATVITEINENTLASRSNYIVYRTRMNGETHVYSAGVYNDVITIDNGELCFREKVIVYDTARIDTQLVTPL